MTSTYFTFDTEYSADAVEWCPISPHHDILAVGTYQVDKSDEETFSAAQRKGRIYLLRWEQKEEAKVVQTLETAPILDMKWCPNVCGSGDIVLATVDAKGKLNIYKLNEENEHLELAKSLQICPEETLALSLDFSTRKSANSEPFITVSDSKGNVTVAHLTSSDIIASEPQKANEYEAWITAFDAWNDKVVFCGGDDHTLKAFSTEQGVLYSLGTRSRGHDAGVTSLLSDVRCEHRLYSGSYDEFLRVWDTRQPKTPLDELKLGGGVWRIKQPISNANTDLVATATMHNGCHVVDVAAGKMSVRAHYEEHESLGYGIDWHPSKEGAIASCSFYDHLLKLWGLADS